MKRILKNIIICLLIALFVWCWSLVTDREAVSRELIRLHVVAHSDKEADQEVKLLVRDAVLSSIQEDLGKAANIDEAKRYLQDNLPKIEHAANETLERAGFQEKASVSLAREAFEKRVYETFSLPAGVYESLKIVIGEGAGQNWWCVAFPGLCIPATSKAFEDAAVGAGFSSDLSSALAGEERYQIRFFLLDALGKMENRFFTG